MSFRRESGIPRGGPDGGDGGKGGDVIFQANPQLSSLLDLRYKRKYYAGNGEPGRGSLMTGASGRNMVIQIPKGTVIRREETDELVVDMADHEEYLFLKGGRGGKGNTFYKSSIQQAPQKAQSGESGHRANLQLELKLLADVGLVGMPNGGKSTFISRVSAVKPKVADYPFTTLIPHLGVVRYTDEKTYVMADIPGLIEGAHRGIGLGIQFLKHIERTKIFIHLIDGSEMASTEPLEAYQVICRELEAYDREQASRLEWTPLMKRPQIVVINKVDIISDLRKKELKKLFAHSSAPPPVTSIHFVSAATGENMQKMVYLVGDRIFNPR